MTFNLENSFGGVWVLSYAFGIIASLHLGKTGATKSGPKANADPSLFVSYRTHSFGIGYYGVFDCNWEVFVRREEKNGKSY